MLRKYEEIWIQFESTIPEWINESERLPVYSLIFIYDNSDWVAGYSLSLKELYPDMQPITTSDEVTVAKTKLVRKMRGSYSDIFILVQVSTMKSELKKHFKYQGLYKCLKNVNKSYKKMDNEDGIT